MLSPETAYRVNCPYCKSEVTVKQEELDQAFVTKVAGSSELVHKSCFDLNMEVRAR